MKKYAKLLNILTIVLAALLIFAVCSSASPADGSDGSVFSGNSDIAAKGPKASASDDSVRSAVNFDHELYLPGAFLTIRSYELRLSAKTYE